MKSIDELIKLAMMPLKKEQDGMESAYNLAILKASNSGDNDRAYELSIGLKQYREMYKSQYPEYRD